MKQNVDYNIVEVGEKPLAPQLILKSKHDDWVNRFYILYMYLLKNQGLKQYLVDRATHSGFTIKDYTAKEDLNTQKPVLFYLLT